MFSSWNSVEILNYKEYLLNVFEVNPRTAEISIYSLLKPVLIGLINIDESLLMKGSSLKYYVKKP